MKQIYEYMMQASNFHSTKLNEYLSTKVDSTEYLDELFPSKPNFNAIKDFLDSKQFICKKPQLVLDSVEKISYFSSLTHCKFYTTPQQYVYDKIIFGNGGIMTKQNPIFCVIISKTNIKDSKFIKYMPEESIVYKKYEDFVDEINKFFKW